MRNVIFSAIIATMSLSGAALSQTSLPMMNQAAVENGMSAGLSAQAAMMILILAAVAAAIAKGVTPPAAAAPIDVIVG